MSTLESLEAYLRKQYDAFDKGRPEDIDAGWFIGYGYRNIAPRAALDQSMLLQFNKMFFDMMERYSITINELNMKIDGNIGLTWGFHSEDFQMKGQKPEKVKVRFSMTLKFENGKWEVIMGHRDIQSFDANGMYIAKPIN